MFRRVDVTPAVHVAQSPVELSLPLVHGEPLPRGELGGVQLKGSGHPENSGLRGSLLWGSPGSSLRSVTGPVPMAGSAPAVFLGLTGALPRECTWLLLLLLLPPLKFSALISLLLE